MQTERFRWHVCLQRVQKARYTTRCNQISDQKFSHLNNFLISIRGFVTDLYERIKHKKEKIDIFRIFVSIFPILEWLPKYKWHTDLFHDIVSGLTVAIMHIPQGKNFSLHSGKSYFDYWLIIRYFICVGIAYSILAGVEPVVGIYMAFFPVIIYALMGTSRQLSMGKKVPYVKLCIM